MEIIDAQVHLNRLGSNWQHAPLEHTLEVGLAAMDAAGVDAVLIDERAAPDIVKDRDPNAIQLPGGIERYRSPFAELAVAKHPDRFAYLTLIDRRDPEMVSLMKEVRSKPGRLCTRVAPAAFAGEGEAFQRGEYAAYFAAAEANRVPVFVYVASELQWLVPYLERHPDLTLIIDHCGFASPGQPGERGAKQVERLAALARRWPNLALKWDKAPMRISSEPYPFRDLELTVRRVFDAFGAERILWGTDVTTLRGHHSWAEGLHYLLDADWLSAAEKEWCFGRSLRKLLGWPAQAPGSSRSQRT